jgi:hypothetical protein
MRLKAQNCAQSDSAMTTIHSDKENFGSTDHQSEDKNN